MRTEYFYNSYCSYCHSICLFLDECWHRGLWGTWRRRPNASQSSFLSWPGKTWNNQHLLNRRVGQGSLRCCGGKSAIWGTLGWNLHRWPEGQLSWWCPTAWQPRKIQYCLRSSAYTRSVSGCSRRSTMSVMSSFVAGCLGTGTIGWTSPMLWVAHCSITSNGGAAPLVAWAAKSTASPTEHAAPSRSSKGTGSLLQYFEWFLVIEWCDYWRRSVWWALQQSCVQNRKLWGHCDIWLPNSNKFILDFKWTSRERSKLKKYPKGILEISHSWPKKPPVLLIDLWTPNWYQLILGSKRMFVPDVLKFPPGIPVQLLITQ